MALPSSGQITLNQIHVEAGGSSGSQVALSDADVKALIGANNDNTAFSDYHGATAASGSVSLVGYSSTTTSNFANGNRTLSSGTKLVVVASVHTFAGASNGGAAPSNVYCGGVNMTKAVGPGGHYHTTTSNGIGVQSSIWYLETTQSGTTLISGTSNGGSSLNGYAFTYEITGYTSATPYATASANNQGSEALSDAIAVNGQSGGVTILAGGAVGPGTLGVAGGNMSMDQQIGITYAQYFVASASSIGGGSTTYAVTKTSNTNTDNVFSLNAVSFG